MIKRLVLVFCFSLLAFMTTFSQEPSIQISLETNNFLFGQQVWAKYTITNLSKETIYIGGKEANGKFYLLEWDAKAFYSDGKEVPQRRSEGMTVGKDVLPKKPLNSGESVIWSQPVPVTDVPIDRLPSGEYKLVFYLNYSINDKIGIFEKKTQFETIFFVNTPAGDDAAWLMYVQDAKKALYQKDTTRDCLNLPLIWGDVLECSFCPPGSRDIIRPILLQKYPTSTYAACLIYSRLKGFAEADFTNPGFIRSFETGLFLSNSYPTESGWVSLTGEDNAAWWSKWSGIILENHPDIWFADELRLKLAINQVALKNYQGAEADLEKLSKEAKPYVAEKAKLFLDVMKQKGWIKEKEAAVQTPLSVPQTTK